MEGFNTLNYAMYAQIPPQFSGCPQEYTPNDYKYRECAVPANADQCKLLKDIHRAKEFRTFFLAVIPLILSLLTLILNVIYVLLATSLVFHDHKGSKKRYIFLMSRSISTVLAQIFFYIVLIAWKTESFDYNTAALFLFVGAMSFLILTGVYVAMTTLLYIAICHPLYYKTKITMARCIAINATIWTVSVGFSIVVGLYTATLFYADTARVKCTFNDCQFPLSVVIVIILCICFFTVLVFYVGMFLRMRWRNSKFQKQESTNENRRLSLERNMHAMRRLSLNLVTFTISKGPIVIVSIVALANLRHLSVLGLGFKSPCKSFEHGELYFQVELMASIVAIIWLLGMLSDPIISMLTDPFILRVLRRWLKKGQHFIRRVRSTHLAVATETEGNSGEF
jgi:hypothetical protein